MRTTILRIALIALLLGAFTSTIVRADGFPQPPYCPPGSVCN